MNGRRGELRLSIAKGHWALGEHEDALAALERAAEEDPCDSVREFAAGLDADSLRGPLAARLEALRAVLARPAASNDDADLAVPRLSTPTLAELLADQGHAGKALRVAEEVLRRRPDDERALAVRERLRAPRSDRERWIAELERWLRSAQQRRMQREAHG
jgi:tetratricopeptide (TPR) repeat protein